MLRPGHNVSLYPSNAPSTRNSYVVIAIALVLLPVTFGKIAILTVLMGMLLGWLGLQSHAADDDDTDDDVMDNQALYRSVVANTAQGVWIIDQDARTTYINTAMSEILGHSADSVIGKTLFELFPEDQHDAIRQDLARRRRGISDHMDYRVHRPDGSTRDTLIAASPVFTADGQYAGSYALFTDVTIQSKQQGQLTASENQSVLSIVIDHTGVIREFSGAVPEFLPPIDVGKTVTDVFADLPEIQQDAARALHGETVCKRYTALGHVIMSYFRPYKFDENQPKNGVIGVVIDMEDLAQNQANEEHHRMILQTMDDIVYTLDEAGYLTSLNAAFGRELGYPTSEWIAQPLASLLHPEDTHFKTMVQRTLVGENVPIFEIRLRAQDGTYLTVEINQQPIRENDRVIGVLAIARDITQRREIERRSLELALERERLVMLGRFVRDVSHDIRTPLSVISSNAYLARRKIKDDVTSIDKHLRRIEEHVNELGKQLEDLLSLDQLGQPSNHVYTDVDLNTIITQVMAEQDLIARDKHHEMVAAPAKPRVIVNGDSNELLRAVRHLLINALNYTPDRGSIRVSVRVVDDEAIVAVQDNGIGIAREHHQRIFEPFFRVDTTRNHDTGGMGLGLNIVKLIVEAHKGRIEVQSEKDTGSTFTIHLPLKS